MANIAIFGYSDRISVAAGQTIRFMISVKGAEHYSAKIVRLISGNADPNGPGFQEEVLTTSVDREYAGRFQPIHAGSHILVDDPHGLLNFASAVSVHAFIMPTTATKGTQSIIARWDPKRHQGWAFLIDEQGRLALWLGDGEGGFVRCAAPVKLMSYVWYSAGASYDGASGRTVITLRPTVNSVNSLLGPIAQLPDATSHEVTSPLLNFGSNAPTIIAGWIKDGEAFGSAAIDAHYNGKIDRPQVYGDALSGAELTQLAVAREPRPPAPRAFWDFSQGIGPSGVPSDHVVDISGNSLHGRCLNAPARAMTGYNWSGREENFIHSPDEYGAIHFHDDDLEDAGWRPDFELTIADSMRSGVYAARVSTGDAVDYIPFFVRPTGRSEARIAFLAPTATYMAYANEHLAFDSSIGQAIMGRTMIVQSEDIYTYEHPELGLSTYDLHSDGSGVCYSTRLRPIPNMRPNYRHETGSLWGFAADLDLIGWLNAKHFSFDVITDEDLDREGVNLIREYKVVLTGSHPEYYSSTMINTLEAFLTSGGRLMYLGGNGFYWVTSYHPDKPHLIEVRKGEGGSRAWQARAGEYYHSTTGERGGVWRNRARAPQKLVGVGFAAQGFDRSSYYRRIADSINS